VGHRDVSRVCCGTEKQEIETNQTGIKLWKSNVAVRSLAAKGRRIGSIEMEIKASVLGFETNPFAWFVYFAVQDHRSSGFPPSSDFGDSSQPQANFRYAFSVFEVASIRALALRSPRRCENQFLIPPKD
jgi:hypothetical protein